MMEVIESIGSLLFLMACLGAACALFGLVSALAYVFS